jgi:hypothetical protein
VGEAKDGFDFLIGEIVYGYDVPGLEGLIGLHRHAAPVNPGGEPASCVRARDAVCTGFEGCPLNGQL